MLSEELIEKAKSGDQVALNRLLKNIEPIVRSFFRRKLGGDSIADDLTQNTLLRLVRGLPELRSNAALKSFSMKAALYELHDHYRWRSRSIEQPFDPASPPAEPSVGTGSVETKIDLDALLSLISPKSRRVLELRAYGYRYKEIAEMTGSSEAAIKMQVKRAFDRLQEALFVILLLGPLVQPLQGLGHHVTFRPSEPALFNEIEPPRG